jgi:hypothetical protein
MERQRVGRRVGHNLERIARWWTSASKEERFRLLKLSIEGEADAPPLKEVQLAIVLAETEAGEVSEG